MRVCVCHQARLMSANHRRTTLRCLSRCDHWDSEMILIHVRDSWRAFARRSGFAAWSAAGKLGRRRSSRVWACPVVALPCMHIVDR